MSLNLTPLNTFVVRYPPTDINSKREFAILKGGSNVSIKIGTTSSYSNTNATFSLPPASPQTIYDRTIWMKFPVRTTFTGTAPVGEYLLLNFRDAFRAFPLSSCISSMTLKINNNAMSLSLSDFIHGGLRYYNNGDMRQICYSQCPSMLDTYQQYSDAVGSNRSPLGGYGDDSFDYSRGSFSLDAITQTAADGSGNATTVIDATIVEPVFISPLLFGNDSGPGLIGVQTFGLEMQFGDLTRMWSHSDSSGRTLNASGINVDLVSRGPPTLLIKQIIPQDLQMIPKNSVYSYFELSNYSTSIGTLAAHGSNGSFITKSSNSVQLGSIPRKVYIWVKQSKSTITFKDPDVFASISQISINWNGIDGILSSASQNDLYNIAKKNGSNQTWSEFRGHTQTLGVNAAGSNNFIGLTGSVLCLTFAEDIGLQSYECSGQQGTYQFAVTCNIENLANTAKEYEMWLWFVSEGTFNIYNNTSLAQIGVVSKMDVLNSARSPILDYQMVKNITGGNFLNDLKSFGKNVYSGLKEGAKDIIPIAKDIVGVAKEVGPLLPMFGLGEDEIDAMNGEGCCGNGVLTGGKRARRSTLRSRLRRV